MGLGIDIRARYAGSEEECRARLRAFVEREPAVVPGRSPATVEYDGVLRASLFFGEEDVDFQFGDEGTLTIGAKTNGAGPGYHAYLVDVLEKLRDACGVTFADGDVDDEAGYWHTRDFEDLRHAMADWLESLAGALVDSHMGGDVSGLAICMGLERVPENAGHYAAHPLGWLERDYFLSIAESGVTDGDCARFFTWWEQEPGPEFYLQCARSMMWCDCNWLPPVTEYEKRVFTAALLCLEAAWDSDPGLCYPVAEWRELAALSDSAEILEELDKRFPPGGSADGAEQGSPTGPIGYRRGSMRYNLGGGWRVSMPGALHEDTDAEDDTVEIFWDGPHTIRVSRFAVSGEDLRAEDLLDTITRRDPAAVHFPLAHENGVQARVIHEPLSGEDGQDYFGSFFFAAVDAGKILYMSVFYDHENDRAWAERIFASFSWQSDY